MGVVAPSAHHSCSTKSVTKTNSARVIQKIFRSTVLKLLRDPRQSLVCLDRRVLKLPRLLPRRWRSLPFELPCEPSRKRSGDDAQGVLGELRILLGGFRESKAAQFGVDLNRLHATIIPSPSRRAVRSRRFGRVKMTEA